MKNGYWGKVLRVNLINKKKKIEKVSEGIWKQLLGGSGYGAKVLLEETPPNIDPLSPENKIIIGVGLYQGAKTPGNAKWSVVTKSPLTGTYLDSAGGGDWAPLFKKCGYDAIIIEGKSKNPVYIYITDEDIEFGDATYMWGMDNYETIKYILKKFGNQRKMSALTIGQSGEMLNPIACLACDGHSFAGRGGSGAVFGSKNLKAVIVSGNKQVPIFNKDLATKISRELMKILASAKNVQEFRKHGTPGAVSFLEALGDSPIKYWNGDEWSEGAEKIGAPNYTNMLKAKPIFCVNCPVGCHRHITLEEPKKWALEGPGPEYETLAMMGGNLLNDNLASICKANEICNRLGIDTVSTGAFIGFLMECYEKYVITKKDTSGIEINWGDSEVVVELTKQIAKLEGLGRLFNKGIVGASKKIGEEKTRDIIVHVKNMDFAGHDPRAAFGAAINYAVGPRGACHERGDAQEISFGFYYPELMKDTFDRFDIKQAPSAAFISQNTSAVFNSLTICKFIIKAAGMTLTQLNDLANSITGWNWSVKELIKAGERIFTLQRLVNIKDGLRRKDDKLPTKMYKPAKTGTRAQKIPVPFEQALEEYYRIRGWNKDGIPTAESLRKLGLEDYIKYIPYIPEK